MKYVPRTDCHNAIDIGTQRYYDEKQVVLPYWLLTGVVWWCKRYEVRPYRNGVEQVSLSEIRSSSKYFPAVVNAGALGISWDRNAGI